MSSFGFHTTGVEVVSAFKENIKGKTILITGASAKGLGAITATSLARGNPAEIILLARSASKVQPVIDEIKEINSDIQTKFVSIELDKFDIVRSAAQEINNTISKLDILINNAGVMAVPYKMSADGFESALAINHLGHFLLTNLLMEKIKAAGRGARIVNLTSEGHKLGGFRFDDWNFSNGDTFDEWSAYGQSKTANILFTVYLAKHLSNAGILSYAVHPGVIFSTSLAVDLDWAKLPDVSEVAMKNTGKPFAIEEAKTDQEGVSTTVVAAISPDIVEKSGCYLTHCQPEEIAEYACSEENAERLWKLSEEMVHQKFEL